MVVNPFKDARQRLANEPRPVGGFQQVKQRLRPVALFGRGLGTFVKIEAALLAVADLLGQFLPARRQFFGAADDPTNVLGVMGSPDVCARVT